MPASWDLQAPAVAQAGEVIEVRGVPQFEAEVQFELVVKRDRLTFEPPPRQELLGGSTERQQLWETYQRANQQTLAASKTLVKPGEQFRVRLRIPQDAYGECHVRMFAVGGDKCAVGSADLTID
jgi:hypothetical protein